MTQRIRHLARLAAVIVAALATMALVPARADAVPYTLNAGSTVSALGSTYTLGSPGCAGFVGASGSCGTWSGTPNVVITASTSVTGTLNAAGSTVVVAGPWLDVTLLDPTNGDCTLRVSAPRTLTYSSGAYRLSSTVGAYTFGTCPPDTQSFVSANLGASPSSASFAAAWVVS